MSGCSERSNRKNEDLKHLIIPFFITHKGCPHKCVFCDQKALTGQRVYSPAARVDDQVKSYLSFSRSLRNRSVEIAFYGGSFTALPISEQEEYLRAARRWIDAGIVHSIRLSTRPDAVDDERLELLKKYGVRLVELGVQSMDDRVLEKSERGHTSADVRKAARLIKAAGLMMGAQVMPGLPGADFWETVRTAIALAELGFDTARIYPTLVLRGTKLEEMWRKGEYRPLTLNKAVIFSAYSCLILERAGVKVIRIGIQATDDLSHGSAIVAGPYHPSFGDMVESFVYLEMERMALKEGANRFYVNPRDLSHAVGLRKRNLKLLAAISGTDVKVYSSDRVARGTLVFCTNGRTGILTRANVGEGLAGRLAANYERRKRKNG